MSTENTTSAWHSTTTTGPKPLAKHSSLDSPCQLIEKRNEADHAETIVSDNQGNLYLSGTCSGPAKFSNRSIPNRGSNDIFLAKLRAN